MSNFKVILAAAAVLVLSIVLAGCIDQGGNNNLGPTNENAVLKIAHSVPSQATVGETFTVSITVTAKKRVSAVSVREALSGLTLVDAGSFIGIDQNTLRGLMLEPSAGESETFSYDASCEHPIRYTITGFAETPEGRVWESVEVNCVEA